jgi:hypothetical protein
MHLKKLVLKDADDPLGAKLPSEVMLEPNAGDNKTPWGIPGEEHKIVLYPIPRYDSHGNVPTASPDDLAGKPGQYKVQFLLSRPGYPIAREREHKFIDDVVGSSHLLIAKPKRSRVKGDTDRIMLQNNMTRTGKTLFLGLPNDEGYLGKFVAENVWAQSSADAERNTYGALTPFLSAWSVNFDIPLHIETIQVTELATRINTLRVRTPQFDINPGIRLTPYLFDEFCKYASVYREGMNSESPFYRFLCLYKIMESVFARRADAAKVARANGTVIARFDEDVPSDREALVALLRRVYPWRDHWEDDLIFDQAIPQEASGKRFSFVREKYLEPIRNSIAHALLRSGEIRTVADQLEGVQNVARWLPFCRIWSRLLLKNEFPRQFAFLFNPGVPLEDQM